MSSAATGCRLSVAIPRKNETKKFSHCQLATV
jgi:hypothetical protein